MFNGKKLQVIREKLGWSLREAERRSGVSKSIIADTERGTANPTMKTLERLAKAYNCEVKDFFEEV